jgi:hypothetical protein
MHTTLISHLGAPVEHKSYPHPLDPEQTAHRVDVGKYWAIYPTFDDALLAVGVAIWYGEPELRDRLTPIEIVSWVIWLECADLNAYEFPSIEFASIQHTDSHAAAELSIGGRALRGTGYGEKEAVHALLELAFSRLGLKPEKADEE